MLLYLSTNTRPDITFAVTQVARFNHSPKKSHASAIKTIVRYLHRTSDKGTIDTPTGDLSIDCYIDANFAGLHGRIPITFHQVESQELDTSSSWEDAQSCENRNFRLRVPSPPWKIRILRSQHQNENSASTSLSLGGSRIGSASSSSIQVNHSLSCLRR